MATSKKKKTEEKPAEKRIRREGFRENLRCPLTKEEIEARADKAANLVENMDNLDNDMKAHQKAKKAELERVAAEHRHLSNEVRTKATYRDIDCERIFDYDEGKVREVRLDTGEELSCREMSDREKQMGLFDGDDKKPDGGSLDDEFSGDGNE